MLKGGNVSVELGQENVVLVYNSNGSTLNIGEVVYVSGSQGNRPAVSRAIATSDGYSATTLGFVAEPIASGDQGYVTTFGFINNIDTSGSIGGTPVWLSPTIAGGWTTTKPIAPQHTVLLGYIVRVHPTVGSIFTHISNGWELGELHDVKDTTTTASYGDLIVKSGSIWVTGKQLTGSYAITGSLTATSFTGSLLGTAATASYVLNAVSASFASTASNITPAISNDVDTRILTANGNGTLNAEGNLTFNGQTLSVLYGVGDEGGEILLGKAATNTTLTGSGVTVDVFQNRLRFFEQGGSARGFYLDISTGGGGASTNLASGGGTVTSVDTAGSVNGITLTGGPITGAGTITLGGTLSGIQSGQLATSSLMIGTTNIALGATGSTLAGLTSVTATNFIGTASYATTALSASYAPSTPAFPYTGSARITGSLGVTGSFTTQTWDGASYVPALSFTDVRRGIFDVTGVDSIDADSRDLYDSAAVNSINWESRRLLDSAAVASIRWDLRSAYDTVDSQSIAWDARLLKIDNGPASYTVNWGSGILRDTSAKNSVDWENRTTIDTSNKNSIDWQNRQLNNTSATEVLNWQSGVTITGATKVTGSLESTGSFKVQGDGTGFAGPYTAIEVNDINFTRKLYDFNVGSGSLDFGNRDLLDSTGNGVFNWTGVSKTIDSRLYLNETISGATRNALITNVGYGGFALNDSEFDTAVQANDLVFLDTDGIWYQVDQTTVSSTKMLGICQGFDPMTNIGTVITEGDIVVTTGTGYPLVQSANYGLPVYIRESGGTLMSTVIPTTGYVRLLGHCYHNAGGTEWIMKFRPSHEWIEL
jgi:hypothetical protein